MKVRAIHLLPLLASAGMTFAQAPQDMEFRVAATSEVPEQLVVLAPQVNVAGRVTDDALICSAGTAELTGLFSNDVVAVGREVNFSGWAGDHVRLAGASVRVSGRLQRSLAAAGQTVQVATNATIDEDVYVAGQQITIEGTVRSNVMIYASRATLGGRIQGNVTVEADNIAVLPGTHIGGNLTYKSTQELFLDKSVTLGGKLQHEAPTVTSGTALGYNLLATLIQGIGTLITGIAMVLLFPRFTGHTVRMLKHAYWRCSMTGAFLFSLLPILAVIAFFTVVGRPFALALGAAYGLLVYLGNIIVALAVGSVLLRQRGPQPVGGVMATLTVGLVALYLVKALPTIGIIVSLAVWMSGLGALVLSLIHSQRVTTGQNPAVFPGTEPAPPPPPV